MDKKPAFKFYIDQWSDARELQKRANEYFSDIFDIQIIDTKFNTILSDNNRIVHSICVTYTKKP